MRSAKPSIPAYVHATVEQIEAAKHTLAQKRKIPGFHFYQGHRQASFRAKLASGMPLTADEFVEFGDLVPEGYSVPQPAPVTKATSVTGNQPAPKRAFDEDAFYQMQMASPIMHACSPLYKVGR